MSAKSIPAPCLSILICMPAGHAQQNDLPIPPPSLAPAVKPLLVGYVPAYDGASLAGSFIGLDLSRITHLNIAAAPARRKAT